MSYYLCNWVIVFGLVLMVYKIRHINDSTKIKAECAVVVAWQLCLSFAQFVTYAVFKVDSCASYHTYVWAGYNATIISYSCAIARDFGTMLITLYY